MADHRHEFPILKMSKVFNVSCSGYYRWLNRPPSERSLFNNTLRKAINRVWESSKKTYGSPRIHRQLVAEGWQVSRARIARMMRTMGIASRIRKKWVNTTHSNHRWAVAAEQLGYKSVLELKKS